MLVVKIYVEPTGKMPTLGRPGDAGIDCYADTSGTYGPITLNPGDSVKIPLGFRYAFFHQIYVPNGASLTEELVPTNDFYYEICNRSGFGTKEKVTELARICDSSYRGVAHYAIAKIGGTTTEISHHQKVCQALIHPFVDPHKTQFIQVDSVEELGTTSRGANGFNSSGSF